MQHRRIAVAVTAGVGAALAALGQTSRKDEADLCELADEARVLGRLLRAD